jgi:hypothetical protein
MEHSPAAFPFIGRPQATLGASHTEAVTNIREMEKRIAAIADPPRVSQAHWHTRLIIGFFFGGQSDMLTPGQGGS